MKTLLNLFTATVLLVFSTTAFAQDKPADSPVTVKVISIYASKDGASFDSSLSSLKGKLLRGFSDYSSFKKVGQTSLTIATGQQSSASLPNGSSISFTLLEGETSYAKLKFEIPGKVSTKLKLSRGSMFFQAGMSYQNGILILSITVK